VIRLGTHAQRESQPDSLHSDNRDEPVRQADWLRTRIPQSRFPGVVDEQWRQAVQAALPGKSQVRVAQC